MEELEVLTSQPGPAGEIAWINASEFHADDPEDREVVFARANRKYPAHTTKSVRDFCLPQKTVVSLYKLVELLDGRKALS